ncbi:hypothetical protein Bbelb_111700 [Branchiostoma belcheri]|nr:hypothetical protein Bbelb_111700 [Branchiostoma belcheri]
MGEEGWGGGIGVGTEEEDVPRNMLCQTGTKHFATAVTADSGTPTAGTPSREDSRQRSPAVMKFSDDSSKVVGRQLSGSPRQLKVRIENSRQREVRVQFVTEHLKCSPRHPEAPVKLCVAQCALNKFLPKGRGFLNVSPDPPVDRITTFCQSNGSGEVSRARRVSNMSRYLNRLLRAPLARRLILDKTRIQGGSWLVGGKRGRGSVGGGWDGKTRRGEGMRGRVRAGGEEVRCPRVTPRGGNVSVEGRRCK